MYCYPSRRLIVRFGRRVIYHLKGLWEYIPKSIPFICLSVPQSSYEWLAFLFMSNLLCYISMDSSRQALQTIRKLLSNFIIIFESLAQKNIQKDSEASISIKILQILFYNIGVGYLCMRGGKAYKLINMLSSFIVSVPLKISSFFIENNLLVAITCKFILLFWLFLRLFCYLIALFCSLLELDSFIYDHYCYFILL